MNERIRQLCRQKADYWMNHYDRKSLADMSLLYNDVEKFAELLEKEFFSAGYLAGKSDGTMETIQECANFLADSLDDHFASEQLIEHFGVES